MAADWCAVMSDSFAEEFNRSFFDAAQGDRKHWPSSWPAGLLFRKRAKRPYRAGTYNRPRRPTTEEYPRFANSSPLALRHIASFGQPIEEYFAPIHAEVAIDADGFVYTGGQTSHIFTPDLIGNPFGSGPDFPHDRFALGRSTMWRQFLRKPYNPLSSFAATRFKKAATFRVDISGGRVACASYLLSDDGQLWASGYPHLTGADDIDAFPAYPSGSVPYFTPRQSATYVTPSGQQLSQDGLVFADIACNVDQTTTFGGFGFYFLAVTTSGKMMIRCDHISSRLGGKWYEASGFVDRVTVSRGGAGYNNNAFITASEPDHPNGVRALVFPVVTAGAITAVRVFEPGWGYTAPPTLTIDQSQNPSSPAVLQAHLFDGQWSKAFSFGSRAAALTTSGRLYAWGERIPSNRLLPSTHDSCYSPRRFHNEFAGGYRDVACTTSQFNPAFVAVRNDGGVDWGRVNPASGVASTWHLQSYTSSVPIKACAAQMARSSTLLPHVCLLGEDGVVSNYGVDTPIAPLQTQARFSAVFSGMETVSVNRIEQLDEYGNRESSLPVIDEGFG